MGVDAKIITDVKDTVILVPNAAVKTTNGQKTVTVLKNGVATPLEVTTGSANDSETEITSGISEGDVVVTATTNSGTTSKSSATSPFSSFGGAVRMGGR